MFLKILPRRALVQRGITHEIEAEPSAKPPSRPHFLLSPAEFDEMQEQIWDLLDQGFIRPSCSPYGEPVLFMPKKDDRWYICMDYPMLNRILQKDQFLILHIHSILDRSGQAKYFTKLDIASGYHQIAAKPQYVEKTAFHTNIGLLEFAVMLFGLVNIINGL